MSADMAANVLAGLIFGVAVYLMVVRVRTGKFPKVRNPFYFED